MRSLTLTLDVDGPQEYALLHDVAIDDVDRSMMYRGPLDRFARLCNALGARGTVFAIGRDVEGEAAERLAQLTADGFEVASHSNAHDYQLSRWHTAAIEEDVARSCDAIERCTGTRPVGFRAPGYHVSEPLFDALETLGLRYDSSVMPSPPYYAAKALVLGAYRLLRRQSASLLGSPRLTTAPRQPYHPSSDPYRRGTRQLVELPISVAGLPGWPVTGASLALAPAWLRLQITRALADQEMLVINLHTMDLVDPTVDGLPESLASKQPELRLPLEERDAALRGTLATLATGREQLTCAELADRVG